MRKALIILAALTAFSANGQNFSNPVRLVEGGVGFLDKQLTVSFLFTKDNIMIDDIPENEFIQSNKSERNRKRPGTGDKWEQSWLSDFKTHYGSFKNGMMEQSTFGKKEGAMYTVIVKTTKIILGFESGVAVASKGSQFFGEVIIVETLKPDKILARLLVEKAKGMHDYNVGGRISWAYYEAGVWTGRTIKKAIQNHLPDLPTNPPSASDLVAIAQLDSNPAVNTTTAPAQETRQEIKTSGTTSQDSKPVAKPTNTSTRDPKPEVRTEPVATKVSQPEVSVKHATEPEKDDAMVAIGKLKWGTRNLDVTSFANGDPIQEVKTLEDWKKARDNRQPAWCYVNDDASTNAKFGKLYNWYAASDQRGLAPSGWHVATIEEFESLIEISKSTANAKSFGGIATTVRLDDGKFAVKDRSIWWSASDYRNSAAWDCILIDAEKAVYGKATHVKGWGFFVRCIKD